MGVDRILAWLHRKKKAKYLGVAGILGFFWYCALLVPPMSRHILWGRTWDERIMLLAIMCIASLVTAWTLRRWIITATGILKNSLFSVLIPAVGCFLFWAQMVIVEAVRDSFWVAYSWHFNWEPIHKPDPVQIFPWLCTLPVLAVVLSFVFCYYVVIPVGFISQHILRRIGRTENSIRDDGTSIKL